MKLYIATAVVALSGAGAALAYDNEPSGFRGLLWGTPLAEVRSQFFMDGTNGPGVRTFTRENENMKIDTIDLQKVTYDFYEEKFVRAWVYVHPDEISLAVRDTFKAQFGAPSHQTSAFIERYLWTGAKTDIVLDCEKPTRFWSCVAMIASKEYMQSQVRDSKAKGGPSSDF